MNKTLSFILLSFLTSCSAAYLDQYQGNGTIKLSASHDTEKNGIALAWDYPEESVRMEILRGSSAQTLQPIKTLLGQSNWLDTSVPPGMEYFYRVKAFNPQGRMVASSDILNGRRAYQDAGSVLAPTDFHIESGSSLRKISLGWIGAEGQSYRLYRSLSPTPNSGYQSIAVLTDHFYQDSSLTPGTTYYYRLSVIYQDASGSVQENFYKSSSGEEYIMGKTLPEA